MHVGCCRLVLDQLEADIEVGVFGCFGHDAFSNGCVSSCGQLGCIGIQSHWFASQDQASTLAYTAGRSIPRRSHLFCAIPSLRDVRTTLPMFCLSLGSPQTDCHVVMTIFYHVYHFIYPVTRFSRQCTAHSKAGSDPYTKVA